MAKIPGRLKAAIAAWLKDSGLSDTEALAALGRTINPRVTGAKFLPARGGRPEVFMTNLTEYPVTSLKSKDESVQDELMRKALSGDLDPEGQERLARLLGVETDTGSDDPLTMTDEDKAACRSMGVDPEVVARMKDDTTITDYRRIVSEVEGRS